MLGVAYSENETGNEKKYDINVEEYFSGFIANKISQWTNCLETAIKKEDDA